MASWHRFFLDFGWFWEASWEGNRSQDRPKKASKNDAKKKSNKVPKKVAIRISNPAPGRRSWVLVFPELGSGKTPLLPGRTRPLAKSITIFDVFRHRFWIVFPPELADRNRPKSNDNRCQGAFHLVLGFVIDFRSIFLRNLDAQIMKNRAPAAARARFLRNRHFKLTSIFDCILVLTWPHFGNKNQPKSVQKPIPRVSTKMIDF